SLIFRALIPPPEPLQKDLPFPVMIFLPPPIHRAISFCTFSPPLESPRWVVNFSWLSVTFLQNGVDLCEKIAPEGQTDIFELVIDLPSGGEHRKNAADFETDSSSQEVRPIILCPAQFPRDFARYFSPVIRTLGKAFIDGFAKRDPHEATRFVPRKGNKRQNQTYKCSNN